MSIQNATLIKKGLAFGGTIPDYSSAIGYKESIGDTCKNPSGYTVGSFFVGSNDGYFYKVTSAIAYGDTLTVGTNCEQTSVAYELNELNAEIVDQTAETDITISVCTSGLQISVNQGFYVGVQLPFIMKNTNYEWKSSNLTLAGYGAVGKNGNNIRKYKNSLYFLTDIVDTRAPLSCFVFGTITLTFKAD